MVSRAAGLEMVCLDVAIVQESHQKSIYGLAWSEEVHSHAKKVSLHGDSEDKKEFRYLATCAGRYLSVYMVPLYSEKPEYPGCGTLDIVQCYFDSHEHEDYYCCVFAGPSRTQVKVSGGENETPYTRRDSTNSVLDANASSQFLCVAGHNGVIQVFDTTRKELRASLRGHRLDIYDLKVSPADEVMVLSASKDRSVRLWNIYTGATVAVFCGDEGKGQ